MVSVAVLWFLWQFCGFRGSSVGHPLDGAATLRTIKMARKIPNKIKWTGSRAREILLHDIENGVLEDDVPIAGAWEYIYSKLEAFEKVPYLQFEERVKAHRKQVQLKRDKAIDDLARLMNTKLTLSPPETFLGTETHLLLCADVMDEIENDNPPATTKEFQARRPEYMQMTTKKFGQRLRQERRYRKYCIHLNEKREAKADPYFDPRSEQDRLPLDSPDQEKHDNEDEDREQDEGRSNANKKKRKKQH